jgi:hypothetical protein
MQAIQSPQAASPAVGTTLLALVTEIDRIADSPDETVDTVLAALDSGRVYLTGSFRGCRLRGD